MNFSIENVSDAVDHLLSSSFLEYICRIASLR